MVAHIPPSGRMGCALPHWNGLGTFPKSMARPITGVQNPCRLELYLFILAQSAGFMLTAAGYVLGHKHKGRAFLAGPHGKTANILFIPMALQLLLGVYLKLHIHEQTLRPWVVRLHGVVGKSYPILAWVQMLFGAIAFGGYCRGDNLGQCLAHYIMVRLELSKPLRISNVSLPGEWIYRVRHHHGHPVARRRGLGTAEWTQSRLVGFVDHHALGEFPQDELLCRSSSEYK